MDDTTTEPGKAWVEYALPKGIEAGNLPILARLFGGLAASILKKKRSHDPDTDPKPLKHMRPLGLISRGMSYDSMKVSPEELPRNEYVVSWLSGKKEEGHKILVATMAVTDYAKEWHDESDIPYDDLQGIDVRRDNGILKGLDRSNQYTKIASGFRGGAGKAKAYSAAELIDEGHTVEYSIGNSYTDLLSNKAVAEALSKHFDWDYQNALELLEENPITNIFIPASKATLEPYQHAFEVFKDSNEVYSEYNPEDVAGAIFRNGSLDTPIGFVVYTGNGSDDSKNMVEIYSGSQAVTEV